MKTYILKFRALIYKTPRKSLHLALYNLWLYGTMYDMTPKVRQLEAVLETLNRQRDELLFPYLRKYWPASVTPNHLSIVRIGLGAILFILLFGTRNDNALLVLPLFFVGILTDLLDGSIARGMNMETAFGAFIDPIADRILIIPVAVYSLITYHKLLLLLIIISEIVNALLTVYSKDKEIVFGSNIFGKTKMVMHSVVFLGILIFWPFSPNIIFIAILWISVGVAILGIAAKISSIRLHHAQQKIKTV